MESTAVTEPGPQGQVASAGSGRGSNKEAKVAAENAVFVSRRAGLRLVVEPRRRRVEADDTVTWSDHHVIEFTAGRFATSNRAEIEFLRSHPLNGDAIDGGFYELGQEFVRAESAPDPGDLIADISRMAVERDVVGLRDVLSAESEGFQRPGVIAAVTGALDALTPEEGSLSEQLAESEPVG